MITDKERCCYLLVILIANESSESNGKCLAHPHARLSGEIVHDEAKRTKVLEEACRNGILQYDPARNGIRNSMGGYSYYPVSAYNIIHLIKVTEYGRQYILSLLDSINRQWEKEDKDMQLREQDILLQKKSNKIEYWSTIATIVAAIVTIVLFIIDKCSSR